MGAALQARAIGNASCFVSSLRWARAFRERGVQSLFGEAFADGVHGLWIDFEGVGDGGVGIKTNWLSISKC